jgi:Group II intron, maturase-specific domain
VIEPRFRSGTFKRRIRKITRRAWGVSITTTLDELAPYMRDWRSYFGFYETLEVLVVLTRWVRLRLRAGIPHLLCASRSTNSILLCGGDRRTQRRDIKRAQRLAKTF